MRTEQHEEGAASGVFAERERWVRWLADTDYGPDWVTSPPPPCDPMDLAREYHRREGKPGETPRDYLGVATRPHT